MSSSVIPATTPVSWTAVPDGSAASPSFAFQNSSGTGFYRVSANVLGISTAGVQRVVVDASGNVGVGTGSPTGQLEISNSADPTSLFYRLSNGAGVGIGRITWDAQNSSSVRASYARVQAEIVSNTAGAHGGALAFYTTGLGALSERMRIDATGAFSFQTTTQSSSKAFFIKNNGETGNGRCTVTLDSGNTNNSSCILSFNKNNVNLWNIFNDTSANNGTDFAIWSVSTGGVTLSSNTATSWSPRSSDERKKKNFETTQGLEEVLQIEPVKYHFKSEEDSEPKRLGFKAQNLQTVVPEMVFSTGEKAEDGSDYLTITPDYLLPVLVKAVQELSAKVDAQAAEIEALKAK